MEYTIPVIAPPPLPSPGATDTEWANYLAYVSICDARDRFDIQQTLTVNSTLAQNARATAEENVALAGQRQAAAQQAFVEALKNPAPTSAPTDADLLVWFMSDLLEAGKVGTSVVTEAKAQLKAYRAATPTPIPAPK